MHVYSVSYTAGSWRTTLQCKLLSMYTDDSKDQSGGTQPGLAQEASGKMQHFMGATTIDLCPQALSALKVWWLLTLAAMQYTQCKAMF